MRCRMWLVLALLVSMMSGAVAAQAQTQGRFFAGGVVFSDDDHTNSALTDDAATSWGLAFGLDFAEHFGMRFTFDMPRHEDFVTEGIYTRPPALPAHEKLTRTRRTMTYAVLGEMHAQIAPRVRVAMPFGLATVTHDSETVITREELRPDGTASPLPDLHDSSDFPWTGLQIGAEVSFQLAGHLEIVPEVRTIFFLLSDSPRPYIVRPGVGIRWRF